MAALKVGKSGSFEFLSDIFIMHKIREMGHFWAQSQFFWTILLICPLDFSRIVPDGRH